MKIFKSEIDNKYRYLYKITNKLTGQYYYGIHSTLKLNDNYMGSGSKIKTAIKSLGINNFKKEYICFYENDELLKTAEYNILTEDVLNDPLCYNIAIGGGEFNCSSIYYVRNIITGESKAIKKGETYDKKNWVHNTFGRKRINKVINNILVVKYIYKDYIQKYLDDGWFLGGTKTNEGKIKINNTEINIFIDKSELQKYLDNGWVKGGLSNSSKGYIRIINKLKNKEKFIDKSELQKYLDNGWIRGSLHTGRIHINKNNIDKMIFESELQKYLYDGLVKGTINHSILGKIKIIKDNKCIVIDKSELQKYLDDGWVKGSQPTTYGKIVVNKNNKNKYIFPNELQKYLDDGWVKGIKKKKNK